MQCQHCDHLHYGVEEHPLPKLDNQIFCQGYAQDITIDTMCVVPLVGAPESMLVLTRTRFPSSGFVKSVFSTRDGGLSRWCWPHPRN